MNKDFTTVTEIAGEEVSSEQIERVRHRYRFAGELCRGKDVLEIACGNGLGLGYLASVSNSLLAGDIDKVLVARAKAHYRDRVSIEVMDAQNLPCADNSLDVIILFEAIYYLPEPDKFMEECNRVLRAGGALIIASANKDLYDFNPSPFSHRYFGTVELAELLARHGYSSQIFGYWPLVQASVLQKFLRPVKKFIVSSGLMPKTMAGKKLLKRLVFGKLVQMPAEFVMEDAGFVSPLAIDKNKPDQKHKVIYCIGKR